MDIKLNKKMLWETGTNIVKTERQRVVQRDKGLLKDVLQCIGKILFAYLFRQKKMQKKEDFQKLAISRLYNKKTNRLRPKHLHIVQTSNDSFFIGEFWWHIQTEFCKIYLGRFTTHFILTVILIHISFSLHIF